MLPISEVSCHIGFDILVMPLEKARLSKKNPTKATLGIVLDIIPAIANVISIILVTGTMMGSARSKMRFR